MQEVHIIAYFYHWTEEAILKLPTAKRKKYIELIRVQVKKESGGDEDGDEDDYIDNSDDIVGYGEEYEDY